MQVITNSPQETFQIAQHFSKNIYPGTNIFFYGDLGSGKTLFIRSLLENYGVTDISSPTYTLIQEYSANHQKFIHTDLYRLQGSLSDLDDYLMDDKTTVLTEWSERIKDLPPIRIEIHFKKLDEQVREIEFKWIGYTLKEKDLTELIAYYKIPQHVQKHIDCVEQISLEVYDHLVERQSILNKDLVQQAALLHDLVRYVDFHGEFKRDGLGYDVDDETWNFWQDMRLKYQGQHHADVVSEILCQKGFFTLSKIILAHKSQTVFNGFNTQYEQILHYADKRCAHDQIVSIKDRITDLKKRYFDLKPDEEYWQKLLAKNLELEASLLS